jgi:hypothetical protein
MIGKPGYGQGLSVYLLRKQRVAAAVTLLLLLGLQCLDLHAELLFRSAEQINGQQRWSPVRKYSNPSDIAYARVSSGGAEEVRVILSGTITRADMDSAAVMERLVKNGKQKIAGNAVWLASDGGDIDVGMELGRLLRKLGIFTFVGENDRCLSACVFAFMGGERRSVAGQIGIHRPYFPFTEELDRQNRFRYLKKVLKGYVEEMDFPDSLYEAVMLVPPESMQILTPADLKRFYLEGISPLTEDMVDAASARRLKLSMAEYLKRKATAPACDFFDAGVGRCDGKVQAAASSRGAADDAGSKQAGIAPSAGRADAIPAGLPLQPRNPPRIDSRNPI